MNELLTIIDLWWPTVTIFTMCVALPLLLLIVYGICGWMDDWEKTFKYPSPMMLPWLRAWVGFVSKDADLVPITPLLTVGMAVACPWLTTAFSIEGISLTIPALTLLGISILLYITKKGFKAIKLLKKHMADKSVHTME